jgi:hypothetical protein
MIIWSTENSNYSKDPGFREVSENNRSSEEPEKL